MVILVIKKLFHKLHPPRGKNIIGEGVQPNKDKKGKKCRKKKKKKKKIKKKKKKQARRLMGLFSNSTSWRYLRLHTVSFTPVWVIYAVHSYSSNFLLIPPRT